MDGWGMRVGELLIPIAEAMRRDLLGGTYMQADETTVDVQSTMGGGRTIRPAYGNAADREAARCSSSAWGVGATDQRSFRNMAATRMVALIDDPFGTDAQARELNLDHAVRHALRLERAKPLLEIIRREDSRSGGSSSASWSIPSWS
jgi:hypothetical protein